MITKFTLILFHKISKQIIGIYTMRIRQYLQQNFFRKQFKCYYIRMAKYQQTINSLLKLADFLANADSEYYVICGSNQSETKVLIHYLLESELEYAIDDEGQDILTITEQLQPISIVDNIISLYNFQNEDSPVRYIRLNRFPDNFDDADDKIIWGICLEYVLRLISKLKFRLLLVFSHEEQIQQILTNFKKYFSVITDFTQRTSMVITRIIDESQFYEVIDQKIPDLIQQDASMQYAKEIIDAKSVFFLYVHQVENEEREELQKDLSINEATIDEATVTGSVLQIYQDLWKDHRKKWEDNAKESMLTAHKMIEAEIILLYHLTCKLQIDNSKENILKENWNKLFGEEFKTVVNDKIDEKDLVSLYERIYRTIIMNPDNFIPLINSEFENLVQLFQRQSCIYKLKVFVDLATVIHKGMTSTMSNDIADFEKIYESGILSKSSFKKIIEGLKDKFDAGFLKQFQPKKESKKEKKKSKKPGKYPSYEMQKKSFKPKDINEISALPTSPLKFDLIVEQLQKLRKSQPRNLLVEKIQMKSLMKILEFYELDKEAILIACVLPDFNSLEIILEKYLSQFQKASPSEDDLVFLKKIITFCLEHLRRYIVLDAIKLYKQSKPNPQQIEQEFDQIQLEGVKKDDRKKSFMDYTWVQGIFSDMPALVNKMIDVEDKNWKKIEMDLWKEAIIRYS